MLSGVSFIGGRVNGRTDEMFECCRVKTSKTKLKAFSVHAFKKKGLLSVSATCSDLISPEKS